MYETHEVSFLDDGPFFMPYVYSIWRVRRDSEAPIFTQVERKYGIGEPKNLYCIFRTYEGSAILNTAKKQFVLTKNTLFLIRVDNIESYFANNEVWEYVCYNFVPNASVPVFRSNTLYNLPPIENEKNKNIEIMNLIKRYSPLNSNLASVLFCDLFFKWSFYVEGNLRSTLPYHNEIEDCIVYINENLDQSLKIEDLAKKYYLSPQVLRRAFLKIIGVPPKTFIVQQKLKKAALLLKTTEYSIQTISEMLGYYSPFQFSRDFKKYFDVSPSKYRNPTLPPQDKFF